MKDITNLLKSAINGNVEAKKQLEAVKHGLYMMVFNKPSESLYENRKNGKHIIEAGTTVIKPGKFEGGLFSRAKSYNKTWMYVSNDELSFLDNAKVYLMSDLTGTTGHYVRSLEHNYISIIKDHLQLVGHEKSASSEWMLSMEDITEDKIKQIYQELHEEIKHDMGSKSRSKRYNLSVLSK